MDKIPISPRCPIRTSLDLLGGKWQLLILDRLGNDALTFSELKQKLQPISDKVLAQTLAKLSDNHLVTVANGKYHRSPAGVAAGPVLMAMVHFGREYERLAMKGNVK